MRVVLLQLTDVSAFPGVRELVRLNPGEGDQYVALAHWILSSKSFAVKTLQKEEVGGYTRCFSSSSVFTPSRALCSPPVPPAV